MDLIQYLDNQKIKYLITNNYLYISSITGICYVVEIFKLCTVSKENNLEYLYNNKPVKLANLNNNQLVYLEEILTDLYKELLITIQLKSKQINSFSKPVKELDFKLKLVSYNESRVTLDVIYKGEKFQVFSTISDVLAMYNSTSLWNKFLGFLNLSTTKKEKKALKLALLKPLILKEKSLYINSILNFKGFNNHIASNNLENINASIFNSFIKNYKTKGINVVYLDLLNKSIEDIYTSIYNSIVNDKQL